MTGLSPGHDGTQARDFDNGHIFLQDGDGSPCSDSQCSADDLHNMINGVDAGAVVGYSQTWNRVQGTLDTVATNLGRAIAIIEQHWQADSANLSKAHLSKLQETSSSLAGNSYSMGNGLEHIGSSIQHAQGSSFDDSSAPGVWTTMKNGINNGLSTLPSQVMWNVPTGGGADTAIPGPGPGVGPGPGIGGPGGPGPGVGPGPGIPKPPTFGGPGPKGPGEGPGPEGPGIPGPGIPGPGTGPGEGPGIGGPGIPGPGIPGPGVGGPGIGGPGGYDGGTGSTLAGLTGGPGGGLGGGGLSGGLGGGGLGGGGLDGGLGGSAGLAGGGLAGGAGGATSGGATLGVGGGPAGIAGPGGRSGTMAPMMGRPGGGSGDDEERERGTWLQEDDDVWGSSDAAPPVIGR